MKRVAFAGICLSLAGCTADVPEGAGRSRQAFTNAVLQPLSTSLDLSGRAFGSSLSTDGESIVAGAESEVSGTSGAAVVFSRAADGWHESRVFGPPEPDDLFAQSVVVSGDTLAIGSAGSVFTYRSTAGSWNDEATLKGDFLYVNFGDALALGQDRLVVGDAEDIFKDSAYVFDRVGSAWTQSARLEPGTTDDVQFGMAVAVSGDVIAVGAPGPVVWHLTGDAPGTVHVFRLQGGNWVETQKLSASDATEGDRFGQTLALVGSTLIVGAWRNGSGKIFVFDDVAGSFQETAVLTSKLGGVSFGENLAYDGTTLLVGTSADNDSGRAETFSRQDGAWVSGPVLLDATLPVGAAFGAAVAVSGDRAAVSAPESDAVDAVQLFGDKQCTPDGTGVVESNGSTSACAPYLCSGGECATSCDNSNQCSSGNVCDTSLGQGQCVATKSAASDQGGCEIRGRAREGWPVSLLVLLAALGIRRAARARATSRLLAGTHRISFGTFVG